MSRPIDRAFFTPRVPVQTQLYELAPKLNPDGTVITYDSESWMTYYERKSPNVKAGEVKTEGLKPWKPFQHYKRWVDHESGTYGANLPYMLYRTLDFFGPKGMIRVRSAADLLTGPQTEFGDFGNPTNGLPVFYDADETEDEGIFLPSPEYLDELITVSVRKLIPHVKAQLSLLNSLIEIKDWVTLRHTFKGIKDLVFRAKQRGIRGTLVESLRSAADLFLQWNFNLAPLISDIKGIHTALTASIEGLKRSMKVAGTPQVARYRTTFKEFSDSTDTSSFAYRRLGLRASPDSQSGYTVGQSDGFGDGVRSVIHSKSEFYAQLRYVARYTATQEKLVSLLAVTDALGLKSSPKIIWDALPWSFVIDWVAKVGPWLDRFTEGSLDPVVDIYDYSWTVKRKRSIDISFLWDAATGAVPHSVPTLQWVDLPTVWEETYRRQPEQPDRNTLILCGLTAQQFRLATALVVSRRKKLRKPRIGRSRRLTRRRIRPKLKHAK